MSTPVKTPGSEADYLEGLRAFDRDSNGLISVAELRNALGALGERLADPEVRGHSIIPLGSTFQIIQLIQAHEERSPGYICIYITVQMDQLLQGVEIITMVRWITQRLSRWFFLLELHCTSLK